MEIQNNSVKNIENRLLFNPYMLGFDTAYKVDSEKYRWYVTIIGIIRELLMECRINMASKGYAYIQDSVIAIIDQGGLNIRFKSDVYPYIAMKYGIKDTANIEHGIRNAIAAAYKISCSEDGPCSEIMTRFGRRPTNKEFLLYLAREVYSRLWAESVEFGRF